MKLAGVAVSRQARPHLAPADPKVSPLILKVTPLAWAVALAWSTPALANPTGAQVAAGAASFSTAGKTLTVTNAPGTIINWQSFSIGAGETTRFQQQSALSAVLNRVTGGDASQILGALSSNGRVFLVNPHGIVFGQGAVINTAGLVASTLNIRDADFIAGRMKFEGGGLGALKNEGTLRASGDIFLVGPQIENAGLIQSENGSVVLAAGRSLTISSPDAQGVQFALQAPADAALNIGAIEAKNAAAMFAGTLRHSGEIRVTSASVDASGRVTLAAQKDAIVDGNSLILLDNLSGRGGRAEITGERVGLFDNATISARGASGGGEILIGGDYQGANPAVRNAQMTHIASGVTLDAGASAGSGGRVIVWADDSTRAHGSIIAAGAQGGGFIETSGKRHLDVSGIRIDAGSGGTWLLDPYNIEVVAGAGSSNNSGVAAFTPTGDNSQIGADLIVGQLNAGTSVTLNTAGAGAQAGDITVSSAIVKTANNTAGLSLIANNDINVNANIDLGLGNADAVFSAGGNFNINNATVTARNIYVTADSIQRSGTQANDLFYSSTTSQGIMRLTTTTGALGSAANPIRFSSYFGFHDSIFNTSAAGAAGDVYLDYTGASTSFFRWFPGTVVTDAATTQTVSLAASLPTNGDIEMYGAITSNDHWIINTGGNLNVSYGATLTGHSITGTFSGDIGYFNTGGNTTAPLTLVTSAVNGPITLTARSFTGTGCGGNNWGVGVAPGSGTVTATSTGSNPSCGGSIQFVHFGGDLLTSKYLLNFTAGLADNYVRLKAADGHLIVDSTAGFNASLNNKDFEVRTLTAGKDIRFAGGTITGNQTRFFSAGNIDNLAPGTDGFREVCATGSCQWRLEAAGGIGLTNPVEGRTDWVGALQSGGAGAAGDIRVKFGGPGYAYIARLATDVASAQNIVMTGDNVLFDAGQPGFAGGDFITANDVYNINLAGGFVFSNWSNTPTAASFDLTAAGDVRRDTSSGQSGHAITTTGALNITSTGGSVGTAGNYILIPSAGTLTVSALNNIYIDAGANPLSLAGLTTGAGAGTIGLRTTAANDLTLGGTTSINDALVLNIGGNVIFPAAASFTTSGGLTLNSPTQIAATATVNVTGGTLSGTGALNNAGTLIKGNAGTSNFSGGFTNSGTVNVNAGTLNLSGGYADGGGALVMGGGGITAPAAGLILNTGTLSGIGTVTGNVTHNGTLNVGSSPGTMTIAGNLTLGAGSTLNVELGGTTQGVNYDLLQVTGTANLNGTMNVSLFGGFTGAAGNVFDVITYGSRTGNFATVNFPAGYTMTATPNAGFYQLLMSTVPGSSGGGSSASSELPLKIAVNDLRILQDKFFADVQPSKQETDEDRKGAVLECK